MSGFSGALVKWRHLLLALMTVLAVICALLIPRVNINADMSLYLPDDSPMKQGMEQMSESLPLLDQHMRMMCVMLTDATLRAEAPAVLDSLTGHLTLDSVKEKGDLTLYRFNITSETDTEGMKAVIGAYYGDRAIVEVDGENLVMDGIGPILITGFALIFLVLFIMCQSLVEGLLFLFTIGIAVLMNMGTNYFLGTVSLITNSLVAILQMVLSMDYSIILMNRYREEKRHTDSREEAMARAIKLSAPTILSSALTTFVGLVMLVFMHFKIGADIGWVVSKGVVFSLICNFTVLPPLILRFDKAIEKTGKRTPSFPIAPIARFERAFRWPLTVAFVIIFVAAFMLQRKTDICFSATWPTRITTEFPPDNPVMILYSTADEDAVPDIMDSLQACPGVISTLSYPSLSVKQLSPAEMAERFSSLSPLVTEEILDIVYYAHAHPQRNERLRLSELEESAKLLADAGLLPGGLNIPDLTLPPEPEPVPEVMPEPEAVPEEMPEPEAPVTMEETSAPADSTASAPGLTYEDATTPLTAGEVARLVGTDRRLISLVYRMAGKKEKDAKMEPVHLVRFVREEVLTKKRFAGMVSKDDVERIHLFGDQLDSVVAAGPTVTVPYVPETPEDSSLVASVPVPAEVPVTPVPELVEAPVEEAYVPTPLEVLAEMAFADGRYPARRVWRALSNAGVPVTRDQMDLLYLYTASRLSTEEPGRMSVGELLDFVCEDILPNPVYADVVPADAAEEILQARQMLSSGVGTLRGEDYSLSLVLTSIEPESEQAYSFLDKARALCAERLEGNHYFIGESPMYQEMKEGFPAELLLLTLLTVAAIFLIVAVTFKSLLIPVILIITVLSGVYVNVWASGFGGNSMLYISYLIIQGVLMGATIDYSILFTNYYRHCRTMMGVRKSLAVTYYRTVNSILTSGLILVVVPLVMSHTVKDPLTASVLHSLSMGALAVLVLILFVMPGVLAALDRVVVPAKPQ